ncbi:thymidylate synthase (FAD), partial [bacterium]|nr:thymidylate synthase (FAD) [bacterium]
DIDDATKQLWTYHILDYFKRGKEIYDGLIADGIAKECARFVLPLATPTRIYMSGSIRSFIHWIQLRSSNGTQKEHMILANEAKNIFKEQLPITSEALGWN